MASPSFANPSAFSRNSAAIFFAFSTISLNFTSSWLFSRSLCGFQHFLFVVKSLDFVDHWMPPTQQARVWKTELSVEFRSFSERAQSGLRVRGIEGYAHDWKQQLPILTKKLPQICQDSVICCPTTAAPLMDRSTGTSCEGCRRVPSSMNSATKMK